MAIDVFFDEGGRDNLLIVSCQVCSTGESFKLDRKWRAELQRVGIEWFHAKDYKNRRGGNLVALSRTKRKHLVRGLCEIIHRHALFGVTVLMDTQLYEREISPACKSQWTSAYAFAISIGLGVAHLLLEPLGRHSEPVDVMIANGHRNLQQALQRLQEFQEHRTPIKVRAVRHSDMPDCPPLQAADLLAYSSLHAVLRQESQISNYLRRPTLGTYRIQTIECDAELVGLLKDGWDKNIEKRQDWWNRKKASNA